MRPKVVLLGSLMRAMKSSRRALGLAVPRARCSRRESCLPRQWTAWRGESARAQPALDDLEALAGSQH